MSVRHGMRTLSLAVLVAVSALGGPKARAQDDVRPAPNRRNSQAYMHYTLGRLMEVEGYLADALVQYRRADGLDEGHCELETAVARVLRALGRLDEALEKSQEAVENCPDDLEALTTHADALLATGQEGRVEELLREIALDDGAPREVAVLYAQALLSQERLTEGESYLLARAQIDSLDPEVASLRGRALLALGRTDEAIIEFKRTLRLDPWNRPVAGMLSRLLIALERPEEGVPILARMLSFSAGFEPEYVSLAAGYSMLGELDLAHATLDTATAKLGETPAILRARGAAFFEGERLAEAVETYERVLALEPDSVAALNFIAYTLADEGRDLEHALEYARRAVELEADNPLVRDTLGWAHFRMGDFEEARTELERAVELGGDNSVILEHLGDALLELGLHEEAVEIWSRALELAPDSESILERLGAYGSMPSPDGDVEEGSR